MVAKTAGFCWGVRRAMDAVLEASARGKGPVQTLGPLIHNPQALELIGRRGVRVAATPGEVGGGTVVIRAHGIPIQELRGLKERQRKGELTVVNATCPEVAKVHSRIKKYSPKGYFTVILGTHGHAESLAHQSFAEHGSAIVANMDEARALTDEQLKQVLVVAQTTFTLDDFQKISDYLVGRAGDIIIENTICDDTWTRQEEARELTRSVDAVIVVGGKNSSNTKHLAELAQQCGKPVQFVETAVELDLPALAGQGTVGILAGASTPTWLVDEVVEVLAQAGKGPGRFSRFLTAAFGSPLILAPGAAFMTFGVHHWLGLPPSWMYPAITGAYVMAMYLLNPYLDPMGLGVKGPARARLLERNKVKLVAVALACLAGAMAVSAAQGIGTLAMVVLASVLGLTYKRGLRLGPRRLRLQAIPASKDLLVAFALAIIAVAVPLWHHQWHWGRRAWAGILLVSALVFARTTIHNILDMQNDQVLGKDTLPIVLGRKAAKRVLELFLAIALVANLWVLPAIHPRFPWLAALIITACCTYPMAYLWLFHERFTIGRRRFEPSVELVFYLAGLLAFV
ncbi:MAG TPA: 4-hydroxy-3-methylbut-2-enyl diphosphate reductase [Holophaga sp.]|nr:4-hydroxy-3-methylbut-2-enyl diphosphate reductase [Holophaga sp.]